MSRKRKEMFAVSDTAITGLSTTKTLTANTYWWSASPNRAAAMPCFTVTPQRFPSP